MSELCADTSQQLQATHEIVLSLGLEEETGASKGCSHDNDFGARCFQEGSESAATTEHDHRKEPSSSSVANWGPVGTAAAVQVGNAAAAAPQVGTVAAVGAVEVAGD